MCDVFPWHLFSAIVLFNVAIISHGGRTASCWWHHFWKVTKYKIVLMSYTFIIPVWKVLPFDPQRCHWIKPWYFFILNKICLSVCLSLCLLHVCLLICLFIFPYLIGSSQETNQKNSPWLLSEFTVKSCNISIFTVKSWKFAVNRWKIAAFHREFTKRSQRIFLIFLLCFLRWALLVLFFTTSLISLCRADKPIWYRKNSINFQSLIRIFLVAGMVWNF